LKNFFLGLSSCLIVFAAPAAAEGLADPTRPPGGYAEEGDEAVAASGPVLESVLLPKKGRPLAVISGHTVRLGETIGDARLVGVSEREAVLEGPAGVERLFLTPGVEKTATGRGNVTQTGTQAETREETQASVRTRNGRKP
jgi:MSHA biogenesis protein MshK